MTDEYIEKLEKRNEELECLIEKLETENAIVVDGIKNIIKDHIDKKWGVSFESVIDSNGHIMNVGVSPLYCLIQSLYKELDKFDDTYDFHSAIKKKKCFTYEAKKYKRLYNKTKKELNKLQNSVSKRGWKHNGKLR